MSKPEDSTPEHLVACALEEAGALGATEADALAVITESESVTVRNGDVEDVERSDQTDLGLRVFVNDRQAVVSTSKLDRLAIRELAQRAVAMARAAPPDPDAGLPSTALLSPADQDLRLAEDTSPDVGRLTDMAQAAEAAALAVSGITNSEGAQASAASSRVLLANSRGFCGSYQGTVRTLSATAVAGNGQGMERDYDYRTSRFLRGLPAPAVIGEEAGQRAVARLNARKIRSGVFPVVFEPRIANSLLSHLAGAINGEAVARGTSFLKDRMGERLFPEGVMVVDDPTRVSGLRSRPFDGEGVPTRRLVVIEGGHLQSWILDCRSARRLGLSTTGHARRSPGGTPSPGTTNFYLEATETSPKELIGSVKAGLLVTELIGMGVNLVTGDYSRGAAGFWIEDGEIRYPVNEITIAGNLKDMFTKLHPASDLEFRYGVDAPTVLIESMTVAGD